MNYSQFTPSELIIKNMVEIDFPDGSEEGFRKVKETLTRLGVANKYKKILYQSCHVLHKQGKYYITHFKEMMALDGNPADISETDISRRNLIVKYLIDWNMITAVSDNWKEPMGVPRMLKVVKHSEVDEWELSPKYAIGSSKYYNNL